MGPCTGSRLEHLHTPSGSLFADLTAPVHHCFVSDRGSRDRGWEPEAHTGLRALGCSSCVFAVPLYLGFCKTRWGGLFCKWDAWPDDMEQPPPVLAYCLIVRKPSHLILTAAQWYVDEPVGIAELLEVLSHLPQEKETERAACSHTW